MAFPERFREYGFSQILSHRAAISSEDPFLARRDGSLTFGELEVRADALAPSLSVSGSGTGSRSSFPAVPTSSSCSMRPPGSARLRFP